MSLLILAAEALPDAGGGIIGTDGAVAGGLVGMVYVLFRLLERHKDSKNGTSHILSNIYTVAKEAVDNQEKMIDQVRDVHQVITTKANNGRPLCYGPSGADDLLEKIYEETREQNDRLKELATTLNERITKIAKKGS